MENRFYTAELAGLERGREFVLVEIVGDPEIGQVDELVAVGQVVDDKDVVMASALSAATILEPIMPAPPVTMIIGTSNC